MAGASDFLSTTLEQFGLTQYEKVLREAEFDTAEVLSTLTPDDLTNLGICKLGAQKKFDLLVASLKTPIDNTVPTRTASRDQSGDTYSGLKSAAPGSPMQSTVNGGGTYPVHTPPTSPHGPAGASSPQATSGFHLPPVVSSRAGSMQTTNQAAARGDSVQVGSASGTTTRGSPQATATGAPAASSPLPSPGSRSVSEAAIAALQRVPSADAAHAPAAPPASPALAALAAAAADGAAAPPGGSAVAWLLAAAAAHAAPRLAHTGAHSGTTAADGTFTPSWLQFDERALPSSTTHPLSGLPVPKRPHEGRLRVPPGVLGGALAHDDIGSGVAPLPIRADGGSRNSPSAVADASTLMSVGLAPRATFDFAAQPSPSRGGGATPAGGSGSGSATSAPRLAAGGSDLLPPLKAAVDEPWEFPCFRDTLPAEGPLDRDTWDGIVAALRAAEAEIQRIKKEGSFSGTLQRPADAPEPHTPAEWAVHLAEERAWVEKAEHLAKLAAERSAILKYEEAMRAAENFARRCNIALEGALADASYVLDVRRGAVPPPPTLAAIPATADANTKELLAQHDSWDEVVAAGDTADTGASTPQRPSSAKAVVGAPGVTVGSPVLIHSPFQRRIQALAEGSALPSLTGRSAVPSASASLATTNAITTGRVALGTTYGYGVAGGPLGGTSVTGGHVLGPMATMESTRPFGFTDADLVTYRDKLEAQEQERSRHAATYKVHCEQMERLRPHVQRMYAVQDSVVDDGWVPNTMKRDAMLIRRAAQLVSHGVRQPSRVCEVDADIYAEQIYRGTIDSHPLYRFLLVGPS